MTKRALYALLSICLIISSAINAQPIKGIGEAELMQLQKFNQFYQYLNGVYVDTVDNETLVEEAIKAALSKLDPHSSYVSAEEMKSIEESFEGSFSGIGIEFNVLQDTIIVVNVLSGGPSQKVGLMAGDRIIEVDSVSVIGTTQTGVPKLLRGPKDSRVDLSIVRSSVASPLHFTIIRDDIPIETIDAAYKVDDKTGYIRVNRFARNTYDEFLEAFNSFGKIDALILDLRNNGGGLLDQAILMTNFFLPEGSLIVSTEGRQVIPEEVVAEEDGLFLDGKVVVLINESSASASEIVSGAIQDWDRGLVVGRRSFGKGLVQRQVPLLDGSAARITVAHYHTPTGRVIQRPYENGHKDEYYQDLSELISSGADTVANGADSLRYTTLIKGRTVYGGGGIFPDIYIKADTTEYSEDWAKLVNRGVINEYIIDFVDKNRDELKSNYPLSDSFIESYEASESMLSDLYDLSDERGVEIDRERVKISEDAIKIQIKALLAQKLWTTDEYFKVSNRYDDDTFQKAMEALSNWGEYGSGIN